MVGHLLNPVFDCTVTVKCLLPHMVSRLKMIAEQASHRPLGDAELKRKMLTAEACPADLLRHEACPEQDITGYCDHAVAPTAACKPEDTKPILERL